MKMIRIFTRSFRDAFKSITRNFSLSMASVLCVTITLIIVAVSIILAYNVKSATKGIEGELNIIVYLKNSATEEDLDNLHSDIKSSDNVATTEVITKEERKTQMAEYDESFATILDYLDENPLFDTIVVSVKDVTKISETAKMISDKPNVETVKYGEGMVEEVVSALDIIQKVTIGIVIAMILVTIFLIGNTIKLTIYSRRNEINIKRLVGASNMTIKLPFLAEGFIIGLIGSIVPICVTIYGYVILYNALHGYLFTELLKLVSPYNFVFYVSISLAVIGACVGMLGSVNAVRKYLKI